MELVLFKNNQEAFNKVNEAFNNGKRIAGVVEATGTGKSYVVMAYILNNLDKKILLIEPYVGIIEHFQNNLKKYYGNKLTNLDIITYTKLTNYSPTELQKLNYDVLILDEFHHIGAPVWGKFVNMLVEYHKNMKIIGTTAYTIRDRNTPYVRDMALVDGFELFSNNIVYEYPLERAIVDGVLPNVVYKSAYIDLKEMLNKIEQILEKKNNYELKVKYQREISKLKKVISSMNITKELIQKNVFMGSKWIYFCPPNAIQNVNDIVTMQNEIKNYLLEKYQANDIIFYTSISRTTDHGKKSRDAFYNDLDLEGNDVTRKIKIMFAINQYNEGIHVPNVDGVIMGRETKSDIVFFEQLGRCLCIRGNTEEKRKQLNNYSIEKLQEICNKRDILINEDTCKEEIINMLLSPTIIDLAGNISYIQNLQNNIVNLLKKEKKEYKHERIITNKDYIYGIYTNIEIINSNIYDLLQNINNKIKLKWADYYTLAENYYREFKTLRIPRSFKTFDGINYAENGYNLGKWLDVQRENYHNFLNNKEEKITISQIDLLNKINMIWQVYGNSWDLMFEKAQEYYNKFGNLEVKNSYVTSDGYNLGIWLTNQRHAYKYFILKNEYESKNIPIPDKVKNSNTNVITKIQIEKLNKIGMIWDIQDYKWHKIYNLVVNYKNTYGNLNIPYSFKTLDGINFCKSGYDLYSWLNKQKQIFNHYCLKENTPGFFWTQERIELLTNLLGTFKENKPAHFDIWLNSYNMALEYYEENGHLNDIKNGELKRWLINQRHIYKKYLGQKIKSSNTMTKEKVDLLNDIGMVWNLEENYIANCKLFKEYNLENYDEVNYYNLLKYSNSDLKRKIQLLQEHNMPLIINNNFNDLIYISYHKLKEYIIEREMKLEKKLK